MAEVKKLLVSIGKYIGIASFKKGYGAQLPNPTLTLHASHILPNMWAIVGDQFYANVNIKAAANRQYAEVQPGIWKQTNEVGFMDDVPDARQAHVDWEEAMAADWLAVEQAAVAAKAIVVATVALPVVPEPVE